MAKDDYYVIVYQILAYLYVKLKSGEPVDANMLKNDGPYFQINEKYWCYVMENLLESGLVRGIVVSKPWGDNTIISGLENMQITPAGLNNRLFLPGQSSFWRIFRILYMI